MQLLDKLKGMPKKKLLAPLLILLLLTVLYFFLVQSRTPPEVTPLPGTLVATDLASPQDAAIYRAVQEFIGALVADDREKVLSLLTADHRTRWTDDSFLYDSALLLPGQRVELGQFRHSVVRYVQPPELGGQTLALVTARYTVQFKNGDVVENEVQVEENMGLQLVANLWLVAADQRLISPRENAQ